MKLPKYTHLVRQSCTYRFSPCEKYRAPTAHIERPARTYIEKPCGRTVYRLQAEHVRVEIRADGAFDMPLFARLDRCGSAACDMCACAHKKNR